MNRGRLIAGIVWLVLAAVLVAGLIGLLQKLMISGVAFIDDLGGLLVEEEMAEMEVSPTAAMGGVLIVDSSTAEPTETPEPEKLVSIPIEQTPEELAEEMKNSSRGGRE